MRFESFDWFIKSHSKLTENVDQYNRIYKYFGGLAYFFGYIIDIFFFIAFYGRSHFYLRYFALMVGIFVSIVLYLAFYESAALSQEAHRPYATINSIIAKRQLTIKSKLKVSQISNYIEYHLKINLFLKMRKWSKT